MKVCLTAAFAVICMLASAESYKLLVIFPLPAPSHGILGRGVIRHLLEAGHEVTYVTSLPSKDALPPNLREIDVSGSLQKLQALNTGKVNLNVNLKELVGSTTNFANTPEFPKFVFNFVRVILENENLQSLAKDTNQTFDGVIVEWFFADLFAGLAPLFKCPLIWFGATEAHWQILKLVDEIPNPSYSVDLFSTNGLPLSFCGRMEELWNVVHRHRMVSATKSDEISAYNQIYGKLAEIRGVKMPDYEDAVHNGSLLLINSHPSLGVPYKLPQNAKYIGGYHINTDVKPLPEDLQKLMDESKNGVIYYSMGSNLKSKDMSDTMKAGLLKLFGTLKETVLWKFEEELSNVPSNVKLLKWAPQPSILAHPNTKMFITHGGQLSTTETIHFGVPIIGIPVYGDQFVNMAGAVKKGFGVSVKLSDDLATPLKTAISEVLNNPSYTQKAKELSRLYHDRLVPPSQELVYWIEYTIRNGGAVHLKSPALHVPLYQKMYLDFIAIVLSVIILLLLIVKRLIRMFTKKEKVKKQ